MYAFHVAIHALPMQASPGEQLYLAGESIDTLEVPEHRSTTLPVTFDHATEQFGSLPRMFCEPDGSFVWVGESTTPAWQVDGTLYDGPGRLEYVEIKGRCPESRFNLLLEALGWPAHPLMFQLVRQGIFLSEESFRQHARRSASESP